MHSGGRRLPLWQWCCSQVWLNYLEIREKLLGLLVLDAWVHNDIVTWYPVYRCGNSVLVSCLERIHNSQNLGGVATSRGRIREDGADGLLRVNDENRADCESNALGVHVGSILVVEHVIEQSDLSLLISNDGETQVTSADLIDVLDPSTMALNSVCG